MKSKLVFFRWSRLALVLLLVFVLLAIPVTAAQAQGGGTEPQGGMNKLSADLLVALTGMLLSLLAYILPPFKRFQMRLGEWTPAFMAGCLFVVAVGYQAVWCAYDWACVLANWQSVVLIWGTAFGVNAGTYSAAIKPAKESARYRVINPGNWQG